MNASSITASAGRLRLSEGENQPVRPVEEGCAMNDIGDFQSIQAGILQGLEVVGVEPRWSVGESGGSSDGVPSRAEVRRGAVVEKALDVVVPF